MFAAFPVRFGFTLKTRIRKKPVYVKPKLPLSPKLRRVKCKGMKFNAREGAFTPHIWKVMKLMAFLLFTAALQVSARSSAQTITISERHIAVGDLFNRIKQQTGYSFLWDDQLLSRSYTVSVEVKNGTIDDVLRQCLSGLPLTYRIDNAIVYILRAGKEKEDPTPVPVASPPVDIHGRVTDSLGNPLAGASVTVKGSGKMVETDANGMFVIKSADDAATLVVSYTGYATREIRAEGKNAVLVALPISTSPLDQVQVIAYGTTTKRLNTGDVTTIKADAFERQPVSNVLGAIEGKVPGMFIQQTSGLPGTAITAQIRGQSSLNNGTSPIYVVDGIPYRPQFSVGGPDGGNSLSADVGYPLDYLNMMDIERIDVLKDADATAIYGSRGANGVIMITTKKGKPGDARLEARFSSGFAQKTFPLSFLRNKEYFQMRREGYANDGITTLPIDAYDINGTWDTTRYTDWQRLQTGKTSQHLDATLSVNGGNATTQYLISGTYHRETLIFPTQAFPNQNASLHFNINTHSLNNRFKMSLTGSFTGNHNTSLQQDMSKYSTHAPDAPPVYTATGALNWANGTWSNPFQSLYNPDIISVSNLLASYQLSYELLPGLELSSNFGYNLIETYEHTSMPLSSLNPLYNPVNNAGFAYQTNHSYTITPQLNYKKRIGQSDLVVVAGASIDNQNINVAGISASDYPSDAQLQSPVGAASTYPYASVSAYKYASLFGRITYNYSDRYIVDLTANRDGSSKFGPGRQFANFGSAACTWIFTKENWWKGLPFLSFGKLRGSYGVTGNDQIGDYRYLSLYQAVYSADTYQNAIGLYPTSLSNPDFAWEVTRKGEVGLELSFLKDRINMTTSYYLSRSSHQLISALLPVLVGPGSVQVNSPALLQNAGLELVISSTNIQHKDFSWKSNFNISFNHNKLVAYPDFQDSYMSIYYTLGKPLSTRNVFHCIGVNDTTGLYQFVDRKGNRTYTPTYTSDYMISKVDGAPKYYGELENSFSYKGFQLGFSLYFVNQRTMDPAVGGNGLAGIMDNNILTSEWEHMWHHPGDKARYEKATASYGSLAYSVTGPVSISDYGIINSSYIRLKNVDLSYNLPKRWLAHLHMSSVLIYIDGQNICTFSSFLGDPEITDFNTTPLLRTFVGGIKVNL